MFDNRLRPRASRPIDGIVRRDDEHALLRGTHTSSSAGIRPGAAGGVCDYAREGHGLPRVSSPRSIRCRRSLEAVMARVSQVAADVERAAEVGDIFRHCHRRQCPSSTAASTCCRMKVRAAILAKHPANFKTSEIDDPGSLAERLRPGTRDAAPRFVDDSSSLLRNGRRILPESADGPAR